MIGYGETVTVLRRPSRSRDGDGELDVHHTIPDCAFAWSAVSEENFQRETSMVSAELYVPKGADIIASDVVERHDGTQYTVVGPAKWGQVQPFTGWDPGVKSVQVRGVF